MRSRTALQCTAPGVPDVYQGDETRSLHLVDPDNRGPVDFAARERMLQELCSAAREEAEALFRELVDHPENGRIKMYVIHRALLARRRSTALRDGRYRPLATTGRKARHVVAFARELEDEVAVTIVPRLIAGLTDGSCPTGAMIWGDTAVQLPDGLARYAWRSEFTDAMVGARRAMRVSNLLAPFPVALLTSA
jgi:(1->4)-alpha-D-glucan 1-alpha-D-glucosylmutase